jgi:hypothetical protein
MQRTFLIHTVTVALLLTPLVHQSRGATPPLPEFDAGTIVGDFARDYDQASEKYSVTEFILVGRIGKIDNRKGMVRIQVVPRELGSNAMIPLYVGFAAKDAAEVAKLKAGDIARINVVYSPMPAPAPIIHEVRGFIGSKITAVGPDPKLATLRQDLVGWVRKNNALRPGPGGTDNNLVADISKKIDASLRHGDDFSFCFGAGLMSSGKVTSLCVQDGKMLPVQWPPAQAALLKLPDMSAVYITTSSTALRRPAQAQITRPVFVGGDNWNLRIPLKGKVPLKVVFTPAFLPGDEVGLISPGEDLSPGGDLPPLEDSPVNCGIRMVCYIGQSRVCFFGSFHVNMLGNGEQLFQFGALPDEIADLKVTAQPAPRIVFFEIVRRTVRKKGEPVDEILSEPVAVILNMSAK